MKYPQIELWLYDTQRELDRDAREGKVCARAAGPAPVRLAPPSPREDDGLEAEKAVVAANCKEGIPTQIFFSATEMADLAGPLLLAATWQQLPFVFGASALRHDGWGGQPMTLHYHGFSGPILPRNLPLFPPDFPLQPYPLQALLQQVLSSRRRPLPRPPRPFPIQAFLQDAGWEEDGPSPESPDGVALLRDWKLWSCLPDQGIFTGDRLWEAPLSYRYPLTWVIEQRLPPHCTVAYTTFMGQKHPNWPDLLCRAIRDLPAGACRWMLVLDDFSPNPAETIVGGHCLGFAVDDRARSITITRDDDARQVFCQALEEYHRELHLLQGGFPF